MQQQQQAFMQQQQEQMLLQQQQQQNHPLFNPAAAAHPLSSLAGTGMFTMPNAVQAAYDSYNGGFLDEFGDDSMAGRYTGQNGDNYAATLERVMGHS